MEKIKKKKSKEENQKNVKLQKYFSMNLSFFL